MSRSNETTAEPSGQTVVNGADKSAFVQRLQTILAHWPSADRLARTMGVSPSAFRKWLKGEAEPSRERLVALARATGVGVAWLAEGEGPAPSFGSLNASPRRRRAMDNPDGPDWDQFIVLPTRTLPGAGNALHRYLALRHDWLRTVCGVEPEHVMLDVAVDEAMAPTIKPRDMLLLDTTHRTIEGNGIYVLDIDNRRHIRRVQRRHDGSVLLISDNGAYHPDIVTNDSLASLTVLGRVVWIGGTV